MEDKKAPDLYRQLAARYGWPDSRYLPLILRRLVTPEEAKILLQFTAPSEEIAERLDMDKETVDRHLQELFEKGVAFPSRKGWRLGRTVDTLQQLTLSNPKYWDSYGGSEYADLWNAFERLEWWPVWLEDAKSMGRPMMRILPAWEAIKDNPGLLPTEDIREIYGKAESIVVIPCSCKREHYDRKCSSPEEVCIALDRSAEYNLSRGVGERLTAEEAIALETAARKHNLIIQAQNSTRTDMVICHCHSCCCADFVACAQFSSICSIYERIAKSRYQAVVNPEKCTACQVCMEACQFEAREMKKYPGMTKWKVYVNPAKCMGCGNCVVKCQKEGAVIMECVRPPEHIPQERLDIYDDGHAEKKT